MTILPDPEGSIAYLLADSARLLRRAFDARVRELGMTSPQARLLLILARTEGENQGFYAERLEVEPISLARMIDRMADAGLLERRPDPADRRAWRIHLTTQARDLVDAVRRTAGPLEDLLLTGLDPDQRAALARSLQAVRTNLCVLREQEANGNG